jgi:hypothetical protein
VPAELVLDEDEVLGPLDASSLDELVDLIS